MITEELSGNKRIIFFSVVLLYFMVGFILILVFLTRYFGPNGASFIGIVYLAAGWLFLYRWKGLFKVMKIKYK
ncbi:MAG: hypothetical protein M1284_00195 [Candidatus Parvarchaeota archaeon]|nr:hypothetical protein [Candidatus Parvarchaeota archaeon]MCL5420162.1 hypothetical protein [Candidatus Parvarchaeota archaeon]